MWPKKATCLHFNTASCILILALWFIRGLVAGGTRAGQMGVGGQITTGYKGAHVDVVWEDIMTDELVEQKHKVRELHSLALVPRFSFTNTQKQRFSLVKSFHLFCMWLLRFKLWVSLESDIRFFVCLVLLCSHWPAEHLLNTAVSLFICIDVCLSTSLVVCKVKWW